MTRANFPAIAFAVFGACALSACQLPASYPQARFEPATVLPVPEGTYLNMGRSLLASNQVEAARDAFIRSIHVEGLSAAALTGAGLASERQGLLLDAKRYFERARLLAPDSVLVHNNLGAVHYRLGDFYAAKQAFQAAFALSSGRNQVAEHNLGLSEMAIRRQENRDLSIAANPVPIQRLGSGVYTLTDPKKAEQEG